MAVPGDFTKIEPRRLTETARELSERIEARFPGSGLGNVSRGLASASAETELRLERLQRPNRWLRFGIALALVVMLGAAIVAPLILTVRTNITELTDLLQGLEALVNNVVFFGIAVWFLVTLEMRPKRKRALAALHELRSIAHIIDLHQLGKDPEQLVFPDLRRKDVAARHVEVVDMVRYLDFCSDLLSITSKLAALYAHYLNDEMVLTAVNDVEQLSGGLSAKIWQKIMILNATPRA